MTVAAGKIAVSADAAVQAFLELPVAVAVLDRELRLVAVNDRLAAQASAARTAHVGVYGADMLSCLEPAAWSAMREVIDTGEPATRLGGLSASSENDHAWLEDYEAWRDPETGEVRGVIAVLIHVGERLMKEVARRQLGRLKGLAALAAELVGTNSETEVAEIVCRHAAAILDATAAAVATGRRGEAVRVVAAAGYDLPTEILRDRLGDGTALADTARAGKAHVLVLGEDWDERFPTGAAFHRAAGLRSTATIPLLSADQTIGALSVSYAEARRVTDEDLATLATLASIGSQAMERSRAADERRRAVTLRDAFIDVMGHELKTPIATIFGGLRTVALYGARLDVATREELLADVTAEAYRLTGLVDDLLVLSRLERGVEVDLREPLMVSHIVRAVAKAKVVNLGLEITVRIPRGIPPVRGERAYVEQVLRNMLSNARKYGQPPYELLVEARGAEVAVRVLDSGPGVPPDPERLFELYYRDASARSHASGSGIGLFVCRELVRLMGGRTWAVNGPAGGAEFGFALPVWTENDE